MDLKELKEVAKPLVKYLRASGNPHQKIIIDQMSVKIISDDVFIPIVEVNKLKKNRKVKSLSGLF